MKRNFLGYGVFLGGGGEEEWGCVHATHGSTCSCVGLPLACCANNCNSCARYICTQHTPPLALPLSVGMIYESSAMQSYPMRCATGTCACARCAWCVLWVALCGLQLSVVARWEVNFCANTILLETTRLGKNTEWKK